MAKRIVRILVPKFVGGAAYAFRPASSMHGDVSLKMRSAHLETGAFQGVRQISGDILLRRCKTCIEPQGMER